MNPTAAPARARATGVPTAGLPGLVRVGPEAAVLDVGSCSAHLWVATLDPGRGLTVSISMKFPTRLGEAIGADGAVSSRGVSRVAGAVTAAVRAADDLGICDLIPYATSAVRDATNSDVVAERVEVESGLVLRFLTGEQEARLSYLAARRWYGAVAGQLLVLDIGGGTIEVAQGHGDVAHLAVSLPLGAGALTRSHLPDHPASKSQLGELRRHIREISAPIAAAVRAHGGGFTAVATSRTYAQLARLTAATRSDATGGPAGSGSLRRADLPAHITRLATMSPTRRARLPGISTPRARQSLAGALVAHTTMDLFGVREVQICPWGLREGILLARSAEAAAQGH